MQHFQMKSFYVLHDSVNREQLYEVICSNFLCIDFFDHANALKQYRNSTSVTQHFPASRQRKSFKRAAKDFEIKQFYAIQLNQRTRIAWINFFYYRNNKVSRTNQQPPQRGGAVPDPIWVGSKWLLDFERVPVTRGTPLHFFAMQPPERPQKGSTQLP